jgi:hypothetical protein
MSEEQRNEELEDPEVEGHVRAGMTDEPTDDGDDEVEGHMRASSPRADAPRAD